MTSHPEPRDGEMIRTTFDTVTEELEPGVVLVRLSGEIDIATTELASAFEARNLAGQHDITLALVGVGRPVDRPLSVTGLGSQFRIFASVAEALNEL